MTTIAVIGATGRIGAPAVKGLLARGLSVNCLTRSPEKSGKLPAGARGVVGDLEKPESLAPVFEGADAALIITANGESETPRGLAAVAAAKAARLGRIVFISVVHPPVAQIPSFLTKLPIEQAIRESGIPYDVLRPNFFFQNDLLAKTGILKFGVYGSPIGLKGQNRIDCVDIAGAAINCLTRGGNDSGDHIMHGPDLINGPDAAAIFSKHLGREIRYGDDNLDTWEAASKAYMPPWLVHALRVMYEDMQARGAIATPAQIAQTRALVGRDLSRFDTFAAAVCAAWKAETP